ncbi:inactive dipeptidyl peptidase 10 [Phthorimaea operculella]|nr:inactive dipeptidyl peptidase 10 [Phthorimaea operculella]
MLNCESRPGPETRCKSRVGPLSPLSPPHSNHAINLDSGTNFLLVELSPIFALSPGRVPRPDSRPGPETRCKSRVGPLSPLSPPHSNHAINLDSGTNFLLVELSPIFALSPGRVPRPDSRPGPETRCKSRVGPLSPLSPPHSNHAINLDSGTNFLLVELSPIFALSPGRVPRPDSRPGPETRCKSRVGPLSPLSPPHSNHAINLDSGTNFLLVELSPIFALSPGRVPRPDVADPKAAKEDVSSVDLYPGDGHNWRSIILSLMVIGFVISGIVTAIYLLGYVDELLYWSGRRMRLDEFLRGDLVGERLPTTWVTAHQIVYQADDGGLIALDTFNNTLTVLVTNHTLRQLNVRGYQCSPSLRYVLFKHNIKEVYQRTFTAHYTVYDVTNDHHIPLFGEGQRSWEWQHAAWLGDDGSLLLAADNEVLASPGPPAKRAPLFHLTNDGSPGRVYNGVSDWLYQADNEVLASPGPPAKRAPLFHLTNDGSPGRVYNGVSDWLYQVDNEVLASPGPPAKQAPLFHLTNDGSPGRVYNGVSDWLYQGQFGSILHGSAWSSPCCWQPTTRCWRVRAHQPSARHCSTSPTMAARGESTMESPIGCIKVSVAAYSMVAPGAVFAAGSRQRGAGEPGPTSQAGATVPPH